LRKANEGETTRSQPARVVDGGAEPTPEVPAEANTESVSITAEERLASGSPEETTALADSEREAASSGEATEVSSARDLGKKGKRKVAECSSMAADGGVDFDAWTTEHADLLASCRIDIDELLSILRIPDCHPRVSRKRPQVALETATEPA